MAAARRAHRSRERTPALEQAGGVTGLILDLLGDAVLGVYLHGSAALSRLHPDSDIDLFAVTTRPTTDAERRALIGRLLPSSGRGDPSGRSRPVNLEMVVQSDVRPWRYPGRLDFQYGDWYRPEFAKGNFAPWNPSNPDLAILLEAVLQADHPLFGPRPSELLDPIPWPDLRRAMLDSIPDLQGDLEGDERNVVLTFARIWTTLATGDIRSKDAAADWAIPRLPLEHRPVLGFARARYLDGEPDEWGELIRRVPPFVDYVIGEIRRTAEDARSASQ